MKTPHDICRESGLNELALDETEFSELCALVQKAIAREQHVNRMNIVVCVLGIAGLGGMFTARFIPNPQIAGPVMGISFFTMLSGIGLFKVFMEPSVNAYDKSLDDIRLGQMQISMDLKRRPSPFRQKLAATANVVPNLEPRLP